MYIKQGVKVLRAPARGGIYVVDKVTPELDEFALVATYTSPNELALIIPIVLLIVSD